MADRYTYLPSLGPFLIVGLIAAEIYRKVASLERWRLMLKMVSVVVAIAALISISYVTVRQIGVWKNSLVFWNFVIKRNREEFPLRIIIWAWHTSLRVCLIWP
jgi:hypothetical protein